MVRGFHKYSLMACFIIKSILKKSRRRSKDASSKSDELKSILKKPQAANVNSIKPKKQVLINDEPQVKLIERVLINWRRFEMRKRMAGVKRVKKLRRIPLKVQCRKWIRLAIINNIVNTAEPAIKRRAIHQLRRSSKRQRIY